MRTSKFSPEQPAHALRPIRDQHAGRRDLPVASGDGVKVLSRWRRTLREFGTRRCANYASAAR